MKRCFSIICVLAVILSLNAAAFAKDFCLLEEVNGSNTTRYYYDNTGKLTESISFNSTSIYQTVQYFYGGDGQLTEKIQSDPSGWLTLYFHYDTQGVQIELENPGMGGDVYSLESEEAVIEEQYDDAGRTVLLTKKYISLSDGFTAVDSYYYSYDSSGRILRFQSTGRTDIFNYNPDGSFTRISMNKRDNSSAIREVYNSRKSIERSVDQYGNITLYSYDASGKMMRKTIINPESGSFPERKEIYNYQYEYGQNGIITAMLEIAESGYQNRTEYNYGYIN